MYAGTSEHKHYNCVLQTTQNLTRYLGGHINASRSNSIKIGGTLWPIKICVAKNCLCKKLLCKCSKVLYVGKVLNGWVIYGQRFKVCGLMTGNCHSYCDCSNESALAEIGLRFFKVTQGCCLFLNSWLTLAWPQHVYPIRKITPWLP